MEKIYKILNWSETPLIKDKIDTVALIVIGCIIIGCIAIVLIIIGLRNLYKDLEELNRFM